MTIAREELIELLEDLTIDDLIQVHNDYCDAVNYSEDRIYYMIELDEVVSYDSPSNTIEKFRRNFSLDDDYFVWTIYGIESFNEYSGIINSYIFPSDIADYMLDNDDDLGTGIDLWKEGEENS